MFTCRFDSGTASLGSVWPPQGQPDLAKPGPASPGWDRPCRSMRVGADLHENQLFPEKRSFRSILIISGPSRPQKWIRLEILRRIDPAGGLGVKIKLISWRIYCTNCVVFTGEQLGSLCKQEIPICMWISKGM